MHISGTTGFNKNNRRENECNLEAAVHLYALNDKILFSFFLSFRLFVTGLSHTQHTYIHMAHIQWKYIERERGTYIGYENWTLSLHTEIGISTYFPSFSSNLLRFLVFKTHFKLCSGNRTTTKKKKKRIYKIVNIYSRFRSSKSKSFSHFLCALFWETISAGDFMLAVSGELFGGLISVWQ